MIYKIYKVTFENGKIYIGVTSRSLKKRRQEHESISKREVGYYFHRALKKYNNPIWEIIYESKDLECIKNKEYYFINLYNTFNSKYGYNLTFGGDGVSGHKHKEETIRKLKEIGKKRAKRNNPHKNLDKYYQNNPEARSENMKKYWQKNRNENMLKNLIGTGKPKKQIELIKDGIVLKFKSLSEAARKTNLSLGSISNLKNGKSNSVKGYKLYG